jgi:hypothetical protein
MTPQEIGKALFNRRLDELVENVMNHKDFSPEFTREYVKATNLYRQVAEYDVKLAQELFISTLMFAYHFATDVTKRAFSKV